MKIKCYKPNNELVLDQFGSRYETIHSFDFEWFFQYKELSEKELAGFNMFPTVNSPELLSKVGLVGHPVRREDCFFYQLKDGKQKGAREIRVSPSENQNRSPSIVFPGIETSNFNVQSSGIREMNTMIYFLLHHKELHYFTSEHPYQKKIVSEDRFPNMETFSVSPPSKNLYHLVEEIPVKLINNTIQDMRDQVIDLLPFNILKKGRKKKK